MNETLTIRWGAHSATGPKPRNEDAWQVVLPTAPLPVSKGHLLLLADGVSDCADGKLAARSSVRSLAADYYATPETWDVPHTFERLLNAQNRWLLSQVTQPLITTLAALVLRGRRYTITHVGDTRVYLLRQGKLTALTADHTWEQAGWQHVLKRALGLDGHVVPDFGDGDLEEGDRFLLATDGVWAALDETRLKVLLSDFPSPEAAAEALTRAALAAGGQDNATAVIADIETLPTRALADDLAGLAQLPLPPKLKIGQVVDGYTITDAPMENRASLLYRVTTPDGQAGLLKTLPGKLHDDARVQRALLTEEWLMRRVSSHYFPDIEPLHARSYLYFVQRWYDGHTLAAHTGGWSIPQAVQIGIRLGKGLGILHRRNIIHRDIKPDNLHQGSDGRLRILDFGAALCPGLTEDGGNETPGTPSFMAPELFAGEPCSVASDLYAAGVTLYFLLTRHYPYGEVEPFQRPRFGDPIPASRYRPDLPQWLEQTLLKAIAKDPAKRFETAEEFVLALERADTASLSPRARPLMERAPLQVWQTIALVSLLLNFVILINWMIKT